MDKKLRLLPYYFTIVCPFSKMKKVAKNGRKCKAKALFFYHRNGRKVKAICLTFLPSFFAPFSKMKKCLKMDKKLMLYPYYFYHFLPLFQK